MRFEELTPELVEKAKGCETREERLAFIQENGIELTDEQLEGIAGGIENEERGSKYCPKNDWGHEWKSTGRTRPGTIWRNLWPDYECQCVHCGRLYWDWFKH